MTREADEYSQDELKDIARKYLRENENKEYRRLARRGELDAYTEERANAARESAHNLIKSRDLRAPGVELGNPRCNSQVRDGLSI